jgi:Sortase domain
MSSWSSWPPGPRARIAIALGLAVLGVVLVWSSLARPASPGTTVVGAPPTVGASASPSAPSPSPAKTAEPDESADLRDKVTGPVLPESEPVVVSISRIGVRSKLIPLDLQDDGEMAIPNPWQVGWFERGATPGALGPAVIAAHVTWNGAPDVFYRLDTMRRGDRIQVTRADGRIAVFRVTRVAQFAKSRFPTEAVYGPIDHAGLRLITCGGTYDAARKRYLDNVIVFARLDSVRKTGG